LELFVESLTSNLAETTAFGFVKCIAPTEEIRVMTLELQPKFAENDGEL